MSLFDLAPLGRGSEAQQDEGQKKNDRGTAGDRPLADRMRPRTLDEYLGQEHVIGHGTALRQQLETGHLSSLILWGPPGVGKTTLAALIANSVHADFISFSAVLSGVKEIKAVMADSEKARRMGHRTVLFIDEIHRFNKAQQDAFLPYVERGDVTLIGATTENPSIEVVSALLSRTKVYALLALEPGQIVELLRRALTDQERGLGAMKLTAGDDELMQIAIDSNGDARSALNTLELAAGIAHDGAITREVLSNAMQRKSLLYDKSGEEHFNIISALHKSVRSSDADAALYWLGRMLESGEDRMYLARRLVRMAIEDIGLADPRAIEQAQACMQAVHFLGPPEGDLALGQLAVYLALAPKSDSTYRAMNRVSEIIATSVAQPVPMHLRNAPTQLMKQMGYAKGYEHAHKNPDAVTEMSCLPDSLADVRFFEPSDRGYEQKLRERMEWLKSAQAALREAKQRDNP